MSIGTASTAIAPLQRSKSRASLQTLSRKWRNCSTPQNTVLMSKHRTPETIRTGTRNATAPQRICLKTKGLARRKPSIRSERWADHVSPDVLLKVVTDFFVEMERRFGSHVHILDWALHLDEATPHIQERHVFDCENRYGLRFAHNRKRHLKH